MLSETYFRYYNKGYIEMGGILFNVGHNDADYNVTKKIDGKTYTCPFYRKWCSMLKRCYNEKSLLQMPSYRGCTVCEEWLSFMNFKAWMETQDWEGKHLDKDLLSNSSIYSPETCVFIDAKLNSFLTLSNKSRGNYPLGVTPNGKKYATHISGKHIGTFETIIEAHQSWQKEKIEQAYEYLHNSDNDLVKSGIQRVINVLADDLNNNRITTSL